MHMLKIVLSLQIITTYMWKATPRGSLSGALNIRDIREGDLWLRTKLLDHAIPRIRCGTHFILGINFQQAFKTLSWHHLTQIPPPPPLGTVYWNVNISYTQQDTMFIPRVIADP